MLLTVPNDGFYSYTVALLPEGDYRFVFTCGSDLDDNAMDSDADSDGYGNSCDSDFNNNGLIDPADVSLLKTRLGSATSPEQDMNGNGLVDPAEFSFLKADLGQPPGPSCCAR